MYLKNKGVLGEIINVFISMSHKIEVNVEQNLVL